MYGIVFNEVGRTVVANQDEAPQVLFVEPDRAMRRWLELVLADHAIRGTMYTIVPGATDAVEQLAAGGISHVFADDLGYDWRVVADAAKVANVPITAFGTSAWVAQRAAEPRLRTIVLHEMGVETFVEAVKECCAEA